MSDKDINQMDFKELRNEVQLLRDELAIMRREYEDLFYNLDTENFSERVKNKLESKLTSGEVETMISQSAEEVKIYAKEEASIQSSSVYSELQLTAQGINSRVADVEGNVSSISLRADSIEMSVKDIVGGEESIFTQTSDGFTLDGTRVTITGILYFTDDDGENAFSIHHDESQGTPYIFISARKPNSSGEYTPIILGDISNGDTNVFISDIGEDNKPATRGWVKNYVGNK